MRLTLGSFVATSRSAVKSGSPSPGSITVSSTVSHRYDPAENGISPAPMPIESACSVPTRSGSGRT
jgi:hypothetical protein